jgi:hypothetical protein
VNNNLDFISGDEMQKEIVETMKALMWVASGVVVMSRNEKVELASKADKLVDKFQRDFMVC